MQPNSAIASFLLQQRMIMIGQLIDDELASSVAAQLLYLQSENSTETIQVLVNSRGGSTVAGLAIYDVIKSVSCPVESWALGQAVGIAAVIACAGAQRLAAPNSRFTLEMPRLAKSLVLDVIDRARGAQGLANRTAGILAGRTGQSEDQILEDMRTGRFFSATEAVNYGFVREVREHDSF
jgi:ATP-dependent Clp protease, protease subunit